MSRTKTIDSNTMAQINHDAIAAGIDLSGWCVNDVTGC